MSHRSALLSALLLCAGPATLHSSGTGVRTATAFVPPPSLHVVPSASSSSPTLVAAGGFEWEDPTDQFDQGVENPYKNPDILKKAGNEDGDADAAASDEGGTGEEGEMKIDPARLLGPRLQGTNLYFVGMMGSGKSAVGDIVARSEWHDICMCCFGFVLIEVALVLAWKYGSSSYASCLWYSLRSLLTTFLTTYPNLNRNGNVQFLGHRHDH